MNKCLLILIWRKTNIYCTLILGWLKLDIHFFFRNYRRYIYISCFRNENYLYGHILNAFYGYIVEAIFFIAWLMHVWLLCSSCQCNFFQFYWLTQELWNMILTLLILYHSKCVFISWNAYVILKQLVLRKRDPIIDSKDFANVRRSQDSQTSFLILRICQEKLPFL